MSLALSTLIYEWRRYLAAMIALAFSGLLVLSLVGLFAGISNSFTASIDRARADIMVLGPKSESLFGGGNSVPRRLMPELYMNPNVVEVADLDGGGGMWQNFPVGKEKRKREFIQIFVVDPEPGAVTLPTDFSEDVRVALLEPYAFAVDQSALSRLGVKLGDRASFNGQTIRVRAILHNYQNIAQPTVYCSRDTLRLLGQASTGERVGPLLVSIKDPTQVETVRDQLNAVAKDRYRAWTRAELAHANQGQLMKDQLIGLVLGFMLVLGSLIGLGITWQTLRGAIYAQIKELASLRALGVSMGSLRWLVMELGFWTGIAGLGMTALFVGVVWLLAHWGGLPMSFPLPWVITMTVMLLIVALLSALFSLGVLKQSQPADLLR
jgi:putative ABC transport system permease protein